MAAFVDDEYRRGDCDGSPIVLRGGATSCGWIGVQLAGYSADHIG
ncbi:MAG: hypothetical protein ACXWH0_11700 [Acidimicrobiia bacterium]